MTWLVALLLAALTLGMAFAHTLELPEKLGYGSHLWTVVNQSMYSYFAAVGGPIEVANLGLLTVLAIGWRHRGRCGRTDIVAVAGCFAAALVVWFVVVNPANAEISRWAPGSVPADWTMWRDRWEFGHVGRFGLMLMGYVLLTKAALDRSRTHPSPVNGAVAVPGPDRRPGSGR